MPFSYLWILFHDSRANSDKLFKDLLTNKIFPKQVLCLHKGLVWKFPSGKLIILTAFFVK